MKSDRAGVFYLFNTILIFSTYEVVSKTLVGKIDSFQISFIRFLLGGLFLLIFVFLSGNMYISKKDLLWVSILGVINVVISMNLLQLSLYVSNAKASNVAVIFSCNPIFVSLFAALVERERLYLYKVIGMLIGVAGVIVVFFEKVQFFGQDYKSPLLALSAAVFFGLYTVIGRKVSVSIGSLKMNSYSFIIGSLLLLPFLFIFKLPVIKFDYSGIYQVLYLSFIATGLAYLIYFKGLERVGASMGSLVYFIKPVLASLIAIVFLKEQAAFSLFAGTALIILGILVVIYWPGMKAKIYSFMQEFKR